MMRMLFIFYIIASLHSFLEPPVNLKDNLNGFKLSRNIIDIILYSALLRVLMKEDCWWFPFCISFFHRISNDLHLSIYWFCKLQVSIVKTSKETTDKVNFNIAYKKEMRNGETYKKLLNDVRNDLVKRSFEAYEILRTNGYFCFLFLILLSTALFDATVTVLRHWLMKLVQMRMYI